MATDRSSANTHEIVQHLNVENAKKAAFVLVLGFLAYHGIIHVQYSSDSCKWLMSDGRFQGYNAWQPYGCMMHRYTKSASRNCMKYISYWGGRNHIAFLGDSRIRQLYFAFIKTISTESVRSYNAHENLTFKDDEINLRVDFIWSPVVNDSMHTLYGAWYEDRNIRPHTVPNLVITGSATWSIKTYNASEDALNNFKAQLTQLKYLFNKVNTTTKVLWMLQDPVIEERLSPNRSMITNKQIDQYNKEAIDGLANSKAEIWSSSRLIAQGHMTDSTDGLHIGKIALEWDIQILLNLYCNNNMNFQDGTCCNSPEPATNVQIVTGIFFGASSIVAFLLIVYRRKQENWHSRRLSDGVTRNGTSHSNGLYKPSEANVMCYDVFVSVAKFGIIMAYIFLCDRTSFFMKENKYYTTSNFFLPLAYLMILGFFFTDDSDQTVVLHRDQTDEWKGWMQLVILIYHFTGASKILPIYMHIRVLVTAYLFMTGYGHFFYFFKKGNYGLFRLCQVLFRMNALVIVLCFVMNRPYQFYYFVPLVSFWYFMVYLTMAVWPQVSAESLEANRSHTLYMIFKIIAIGTLITLLYSSEVLFEKIFLCKPIKPLFVLSDDSIHEWRFRWQLDRYSIIYGMLFAFGYLLMRKLELLVDNNKDTLFSRSVTLVVLALAAAAVGGYTMFANLCRNKRECNEIHPYISFLPLAGFILLRNVPGWLRMRYSSFFAWFGKISLELFIAQYHIWLAADTHGVLVLVPNYPVMNLIVTSFIFVCIAHEIHKITETLAKYVVPESLTSICRNFVIFLAIVIPASISRGVYSS